LKEVLNSEISDEKIIAYELTATEYGLHINTPDLLLKANQDCLKG
jgi:hypothetical protein